MVGVYFSAEMQLVYSTDPADWADKQMVIVEKELFIETL